MTTISPILIISPAFALFIFIISALYTLYIAPYIYIFHMAIGNIYFSFAFDMCLLLMLPLFSPISYVASFRVFSVSRACRHCLLDKVITFLYHLRASLIHVMILRLDLIKRFIFLDVFSHGWRRLAIYGPHPRPLSAPWRRKLDFDSQAAALCCLTLPPSILTYLRIFADTPYNVDTKLIVA